MDYKSLKKIINETLTIFTKSTSTEAEIIVTERRESKSSKESLASIKEMDQYRNKFTSKLSEEIKKVYLFFISCERELYVSINSHLHIRHAFEYKLNIN